ncbi:hypothetical protein [Streptococcus ferus]|uniref:hypothetical protein n=1 Tax=Streptococcus ferus TaxID=1345 RepID=UPI0035A1884C
MNIFDVYEFNSLAKKVGEMGTLEECLKLFDIIYFEGSQREGNEGRVVFEFNKTHTIAIEVSFMEKTIRFWGWIGVRGSGDYFWNYVYEEYKVLFNRILDLLLVRYFSSSEVIKIEVVGTTKSNTLIHWWENKDGSMET